MDYAFWGFWLSLVGVSSAGVQILKYIKEQRHGITAEMMWRSSAHEGSDLLILNRGARPVNVYWFSLDWAEPSRLGKWLPWGTKIVRNEYDLEDSYSNFTVEPHKQYQTNFSDQRHIGRAPTERSALCLRLWTTVRKRPIFLWLG
jgi:hypothetical protein